MSYLTPLGKRVLVRDTTPEAKERVVGGGLIVPVAVNANQQVGRGVVVDVGPEVLDIISDCTVVFPTYVGYKITVDDQDYILLNDIDILAVIEDD